MKRFFIAAAALLLTATASQAQTAAQDGQATHHKGMHAHKNGFDKLNLSDEQKSKMKELSSSYHKQIKALRSDNSLSADDLKSKTMALRKEQHQKMQSLLTNDQKAQLAQGNKFAQKINRAENKHFDRMKDKLGLTDEQAGKLKASQAASMQKIKGIRQDQSLTEDQKKEQVRNVMKQQHQQLKSLLTPEQLQKMKAGRKNNRTV